MSMNLVAIQGRMVQTPELKKTGTDLSVTNFTLAVDRNDKEKSVDFIDVVAWRQTAEFACRFFTRGSQIIVQGGLQTRTWQDKDNKKHKVVEIVADKCHFCGSKQDNTEQSPIDKIQAAIVEPTAQISDDDLPF